MNHVADDGIVLEVLRSAFCRLRAGRRTRRLPRSTGEGFYLREISGKLKFPYGSRCQRIKRGERLARVIEAKWCVRLRKRAVAPDPLFDPANERLRA